MGKLMRPCDVCDGDGVENDAGAGPVECHLCEGAGGFDENGDPADDECQRCEDWQRLGLSNTCPSCDMAGYGNG